MAKKPVRPSKRKFYRTIVEIEILSERPPRLTALSEVLAAVAEETDGCTGNFRVKPSEQIDAPTMARDLKGQGTDPYEFDLTDSGEDI